MDNTPLPAALCSCMELQSSLLVQTLQGVIDVRLLYSPHITATAKQHEALLPHFGRAPMDQEQ